MEKLAKDVLDDASLNAFVETESDEKEFDYDDIKLLNVLIENRLWLIAKLGKTYCKDPRLEKFIALKESLVCLGEYMMLRERCFT